MFGDCMQELYTGCGESLGPHNVYFSHTWLGVWLLNYGFQKMHKVFKAGNEIR